MQSYSNQFVSECRKRVWEHGWMRSWRGWGSDYVEDLEKHLGRDVDGSSNSRARWLLPGLDAAPTVTATTFAAVEWADRRKHARFPVDDTTDANWSRHGLRLHVRLQFLFYSIYFDVHGIFVSEHWRKIWSWFSCNWGDFSSGLWERRIDLEQGCNHGGGRGSLRDTRVWVHAQGFSGSQVRQLADCSQGVFRWVIVSRNPSAFVYAL